MEMGTTDETTNEDAYAATEASTRELTAVIVKHLAKIIDRVDPDILRAALMDEPAPESTLLAELESTRAKNIQFEAELDLKKRHTAALARNLCAKDKANAKLIKENAALKGGSANVHEQPLSMLRKKVRPGIVSRPTECT